MSTPIIPTLVLTLDGREVNRLRLDGVHVAPPGEASQTPPLKAQMTDLYARIEAALSSEGVQIAISPLDFHIAVSQALMTDPTGDEVLIRVPVRGEAPAGPKEDSATLAELDELFDLSSLNERKNA